MADDTQDALSRQAQWVGGEKLISRITVEALPHPDLVSLAAGFMQLAARAIRPVTASLQRGRPS